MYAVYKQAHPPTGLEFSMYCNFFNNSERNLVVAGTSQLYVYRLNRDAEVGPRRRLPPSTAQCSPRRRPRCQGEARGSQRLSARLPRDPADPSTPPAWARARPRASYLLFCFSNQVGTGTPAVGSVVGEQNLKRTGSGTPPQNKETHL